MVQLSTSFSLLLVLASVSYSHPHSYSASEVVKRALFQKEARSSLAACQEKLKARGGVYERNIVRRKTLADKIREERGLMKRKSPGRRDLDTVLNTTHLSNLTGVTNDTDASTLFAGLSSCVLAPEVTQGPYYVDGEYVRYDLREVQEGVDLYVDVQLIDTDTCEPVSNVYIDFWHANATGVYSGIVAGGNGNNADASNINSTFLRGIQETDSDGVAQFLTVFPGHYTSRSQHIHILAHPTNGSLLSNGTYDSSTASHVGQLFFDQDLIDAVEQVSPYSTNTQPITTNEEDSILSQEAEDIDPVVEYVLLGDDVSDGIMAWSSIGVAVNASYSVTPAATLTENGGVANADSNSGPPSGSPPSGTPPSSSATSSA